MRNGTGSRTAFALLVTSAFYTMGFVHEVDDLAANDVVLNGGNHSVPPPPPSAWERFWNTLAGWANALWDAVTAVRAFFAAVGRWLADVFVGLYVGLVEGDWTYFQDRVIGPLRAAFEALFAFLVELAVALVNSVVSGILFLLSPLANRIAGIHASFHGAVKRYSSTGRTSEFIVFSNSLTGLIDLASLITLLLGAVLLVVGVLTLPFSFIIGAVLIAVAAVLMVSLFAGASNRLSPLPDVAGSDPLRPDVPAKQLAHENAQGEEDVALTLLFEILAASFAYMASWVARRLAVAVGAPTGFIGIVQNLAITMVAVLFALWLGQQEVPEGVRKLVNQAVGVVLFMLGILALIMDILLLPKIAWQAWHVLLYSASLIFTGISLYASAHLLGWV